MYNDSLTSEPGLDKKDCKYHVLCLMMLLLKLIIITGAKLPSKYWDSPKGLHVLSTWTHLLK